MTVHHDLHVGRSAARSASCVGGMLLQSAAPAACYLAGVDVVAWGLASWTGAGLTLALLTRWLPPWRRRHLLAVIAAGLLGGWAGGVLATALGFGGLLGFDPRFLIIVGFAALLTLLVLALWGTRKRRAPRAAVRA
jgi:MFS family permease